MFYSHTQARAKLPKKRRRIVPVEHLPRSLAIRSNPNQHLHQYHNQAAVVAAQARLSPAQLAASANQHFSYYGSATQPNPVGGIGIQVGAPSVLIPRGATLDTARARINLSSKDLIPTKTTSIGNSAPPDSSTIVPQTNSDSSKQLSGLSATGTGNFTASTTATHCVASTNNNNDNISSIDRDNNNGDKIKTGNATTKKHPLANDSDCDDTSDKAASFGKLNSRLSNAISTGKALKANEQQQRIISKEENSNNNNNNSAAADKNKPSGNSDANVIPCSADTTLAQANQILRQQQQQQQQQSMLARAKTKTEARQEVLRAKVDEVDLASELEARKRNKSNGNKFEAKPAAAAIQNLNNKTQTTEAPTTTTSKARATLKSLESAAAMTTAAQTSNDSASCLACHNEKQQRDRKDSSDNSTVL